MTVILATSKLLVGDRRITDDDGKVICAPHTKVFQNRHLSVGVCGDFMCIMAVGAAVDEGVDSLEYLTDMLSESSEALVVMHGKIYLVGSERVVEQLRPVHAVGSGAMAALGYLSGAGGSADRGALRRAVACAADLDPCCGDGVDVIRPK